MVPFAIAGIQIPIVAGIDNIPAMRAALDVLMHRFPWVQMAIFSELAAFGPRRHALPPDGPVETRLSGDGEGAPPLAGSGELFRAAWPRHSQYGSGHRSGGRVVARYTRCSRSSPTRRELQPAPISASSMFPRWAVRAIDLL